jgi:phage repressor protein C with HTH and peptisase S24 domain
LDLWLIRGLSQHRLSFFNEHMLQLATNERFASFRRMATSEPDDVKLGLALRALRERRRWTQGQVARLLKPAMTSQAWQKYEAGERHFTGEKIADALNVLGATEEDLQAELSGKGGTPLPMFPRSLPAEPRGIVIPIRGIARMGQAGPQVFDEPAETRTIDLLQFFGPDADAMELAGESMLGWGETGDVVIFDRKRWPKRGKPCVIETMKGELLCKFFEKQDGANLFYSETYPERRTLHTPLTKLKGVYAVRAKLES